MTSFSPHAKGSQDWGGPNMIKEQYSKSTRESIDRYLNTGDYHPFDSGFPGTNALEIAKSVGSILRESLLVAIAKSRAQSRFVAAGRVPKNLKSYTRRRVEPMVTGLFPTVERRNILQLLQASTVFVTDETMPRIVEYESLGTAWTIANMYLLSHQAVPLAEDTGSILGMASETRSYISIEYFAETNPYCSYLVHECAHAFHNNKRRVVGLPETRKKQWLLPISFRHRETFAYSCEFYSTIVARSKTKADRLHQLSAYRKLSPCPEECVDAAEVDAILEQAVNARNGWKAILKRCS